MSNRTEKKGEANEREKQGYSDEKVEVDPTSEIAEEQVAEEGEFEGEVESGIEIFDRVKFAFKLSAKGSKRAGMKMAQMFLATVVFLGSIAGAIAIVLIKIYGKTRGK